MKKYIEPNIKIFEFDREEILTDSTGLTDGDENNFNTGGNSSIIISGGSKSNIYQ